jgi:N-acetylneuraminic acid mutarotase
MPRFFIPLLAASAWLGAAAQESVPVSAALRWESLPPIPDAKGFAGSFVAASGEVLLVAGGANFPDKPPAEGGTKVWHDQVFALVRGSAAWRAAGRLPAPSGYGVSLAVAEGALWLGGGDAKTNSAEVWHVRWEGAQAQFAAWPQLPQPLAMAAGAVVGRTLFIAGGMTRPDAPQAEAGVYALNLDDRAAGWRRLAACPGGPRFLATAAAHEGAFYLFGGARLIAGPDGKTRREWLRDAWRYDARAGWKRLADLPHAVVAAPAPAPVRGGKNLLLGGDDGAQVDVAPAAHRGFPRELLAYDPAHDTWSVAGMLPFGLVTTPLVEWQGRLVVPGGEERPGIRSTAVWAGK